MRKVFNTDEGHGMGFWSNPKYRRLSAEDSSAGLKIPPEAKKYARRAFTKSNYRRRLKSYRRGSYSRARGDRQRAYVSCNTYPPCRRHT